MNLSDELRLSLQSGQHRKSTTFGMPVHIASMPNAEALDGYADHFQGVNWLGDYPGLVGTTPNCKRIAWFVPGYGGLDGGRNFKVTVAGVQEITGQVDRHEEPKLAEFMFALEGLGITTNFPNNEFINKTLAGYQNERGQVESPLSVQRVLEDYSGITLLNGPLEKGHTESSFVLFNPDNLSLTAIDPISRRVITGISPVITLPGFSHSTRPAPGCDRLVLFVVKAEFIR
jgi:hypothetical protein